MQKSLVPEQLCHESGYYHCDDNTNAPSIGKSALSMKSKITSALKAVQENQGNLAQCVALMTTVLERQAQPAAAAITTPVRVPQKPSFLEALG